MEKLTQKNIHSLSRFIQLWRKPYPVFQSKSTRLMMSLGISCFVWFLLFSVEIYGMDAFPTFERLYWSGIYSLGCLLIMLFNTFVVQDFVFKKYTIGNSILWLIWIIQCIAITIFFIGIWIGINEFYLSHFLYDLVSMLPIAFLISLMTILIHDRYFLEKKLSDIEITYLKVTDNDDVIILFKSEEKNRKKDFHVLLSRVLYVQAGGNYVEVYFRTDNRTEHKLIRTKLIHLEKEPPHPDLVRCHKSYMVNRRNINSVRSSGIRLNDDSNVIPLSDTYRKNFR